jgi:hypothetical protein
MHALGVEAHQPLGRPIGEAGRGLLRTHSPSPGAVGVAVARPKSVLQLVRRDVSRTKSRPRTRPTQRRPTAVNDNAGPLMQAATAANSVAKRVR